MKKTILLAGIIASMTTMANVTGFVEGNGEGEVRFNKTIEGKTFVDGDIKDLSVKGEVKVNKLTLGAVLKNKDIKAISKVKPLTTEMYTENLLDNSSVYAKYELPEFAGIKSYVKGTLNPKAKYEVDKTLNFKKGNVELEGQLAHSFSNGAEVSLTSKTTFPFEKKDGKYGKAASSEHTLKLEAKKLNNFEDLEASLTIGHVYAKDGFRKAELNAKGTYVGLKDTKLNGEFNFIDEKEDDGKTDKNMAVSLKAGANYKGVKDLELDGKFNFKYQVKGTSKVKDIITDSDIVLSKDAYAHSYELGAKYKGVKDLELTAGAFVQHVHFDEGGLGNYVANPLELVYAQSLMSGNKDFFKHYAEELKAQKEEFENAQETIKKVKEADKKAYEDAVKEYHQLVADAKSILDSDVTTKKTAYDGVVEANKKTAKKAYDKQVEINGYEKEIDNLNKKYADLNKLIVDYNTASKEDFRNTATQIAELQKITNQINALEAKKDTANTELGNINGDGKNEGVNYANAQYKKDSFSEESFKSNTNTSKYKKNATTHKYEKSRDNDAKTPNVFYTATKTEYGNALALVNKYNAFDFAQETYKEAIKHTKGITAKLDLVNFGFKLGAEYKGVKNLTLTADGVFAGRYHSGYDQLLKFPAYTTGYVKLHAGAKYDFKLLNDKLIVSPEGNVTAKFTDIYAGLCNPSLVLAPKVSVEYKPIEELKVKGSVEVPVRFGLNEINEFGYKNTGIKGSLNMRYEWK